LPANVKRLLLHLVALIFACPCAAYEVDPAVTFPLGEHYRIGRYVPAQLQTPPGQPASILASGAVGAELPDGNAMAPVLVVAALNDVRLSLGNQAIEPRLSPLRVLRPDQRLAGIATDADDAGKLLRELFPAKAIVRAPLGRTEPLPGPAMAWTSLDALLLDPSAAARVSVEQLTTLRASGVAVAIRVDARPASDWPWQQRGAWWVLPPDESASVDVVQPDRYAPAGDLAGASTHVRQVIIASLACFALAIIAISLWRLRRAWVAGVAVSVLVACGVCLWMTTQPTSATRVVEGRSGDWSDRYTQHVARADGEVGHVIDANAAAAWPILFSPNHARDVNLALQCRADGTPAAFVARLKRGQSLVFLERSRVAVTPAPSPATAPATRTR
jgi:hypothetical protein